MMYPFLTLNDETEVTHSEMFPDGRVKVYIETPVDWGFKDATCWLPKYEWEVHGYSVGEMKYYKELVKNNVHLIIDRAKKNLNLRLHAQVEERIRMLLEEAVDEEQIVQNLMSRFSFSEHIARRMWMQYSDEMPDLVLESKKIRKKYSVDDNK